MPNKTDTSSRDDNSVPRDNGYPASGYEHKFVPTGGFDRLRSVGVQFTDAQKDLIKSLENLN